ncbi:RimJ/RimL family protein N-acetyltransferase [Rhizomicrobium palustre]|uniref:RimJ/RimL family protein N-acetyltransferase n=1 Tax=Rhizomicrobium palustre TaxID=189966 RepID=A0A846MZA3_9PROT|nr:GNAT family N-acetyltransferase [Rhizomicrobium palustre]NIK88643.1 RimJ/RimL family protein N-acetyltransferase [Rhizomicrobium palustre]
MPRLETERLLLRPPVFGDAPAIARWLGDYEIAKNMDSSPFPITTRDAEHLVKKAIEDQARGEAYSFAIVRKESGRLLGFCSLTLHEGAYEISFWIARPFWGQGFASEAAKKLAGFAFKTLKAERIAARWFDDAPASGRVLGKLGFTPLRAEASTTPARGLKALSHRMELYRENFGRKPRRVSPQQSHWVPQRSGLRWDAALTCCQGA